MPFHDCSPDELDGALGIAIATFADNDLTEEQLTKCQAAIVPAMSGSMPLGIRCHFHKDGTTVTIINEHAEEICEGHSTLHPQEIWNAGEGLLYALARAFAQLSQRYMDDAIRMSHIVKQAQSAEKEARGRVDRGEGTVTHLPNINQMLTDLLRKAVGLDD